MTDDGPVTLGAIPGYHAQRDPMPAELRVQWEQAPALLESLGWTVATDDELEADDVMFSYALAETAANGRGSGRGKGAGGGPESGRALLLSGDRDMYQAVNDQVSVVLPGKASGAPTEIGPEQVRERYGIDPALVTDFIALRGDPSDGLPGAPGIGAKTAAELLNEYGPLEDVLKAAEADDSDMRLRTATMLSENAELLRTFKQIAMLVPIGGIARPPDRLTDFAAGASAARELGMRQLATRLEKLASATA